MAKEDRIAAFVESLGLDASHFDARYLGFFACFQRGDYYEAHDVLEDLWLRESGPDRDFYKGLIQLAGAFVHLKKQRERPSHPKDGRRLRPAARLLALARRNIAPFAPVHHGLEAGALCERCAQIEAEIVRREFRENPLCPGRTHPLNILEFFRHTQG